MGYRLRLWLSFLSLGTPAIVPLIIDFGRDLDLASWLANLFFTIASFTLAMIVHECGHAVSARALGIDVVRIQFGTGPRLWRGRARDVDLWWCAIPFGGTTFLAPRSTRWVRTRMCLTLLAGPAVNGAIAAAIWIAVEPASASRFLVGHGLVLHVAPLDALFVVNVWVMGLNLIPFVRGNDGSTLLTVPFQRDEDLEDVIHVRELLALEELREKKRIDEAFARCEAALAGTPRSVALRTSMANLLLERNEHQRAYDLYVDLLASDLRGLRLAVVQNNAAWTALYLDRPELYSQALARAEQAHRAARHQPALRGTYGATLIANGRVDEGLAHVYYAYAIASASDARAHNACWLAIGEAHRGNLDAARRYLESARSLDPRSYSIPFAERVLRERTPSASVA